MRGAWTGLPRVTAVGQGQKGGPPILLDSKPLGLSLWGGRRLRAPHRQLQGWTEANTEADGEGS